jgi:predicted O-methyltransferase YrrM
VPVEELDLGAWFAGKTFRHKDYVTRKAKTWSSTLAPLRETATEVLEIGSLEGRSALFFLNYLQGAKLTCIDPFYAEGLEATFDANVAPFGERVVKVKDFSFPALTKLRRKKRTFDVIYIDGLHEREAVLLDSVLSWPMLRQGGVLIWDDYIYGMDRAAADRAKEAIDGFLTAYVGDYVELYRRKQLIVKKTVEGPYPRLRKSITPRSWKRLLNPLRR